MMDISSLFQTHLTSYSAFDKLMTVWSIWITLFILIERTMFILLKKGWKIPIFLLSMGKKLIAFSILSSYLIIFYWIVSLFQVKLYAFFIIIFYLITGYVYKKYLLRLLSSIITVIFMVALILRSFI